jgi:hypothetical protein
MGFYVLDLKQKKMLHNVKYATRLAKLRRGYIINSHGKMGMETQSCTTDHRSMAANSKTTKFIQSKPLVRVINGIVPF